jgi:phage head maturation protease
MSVVFRVEPDGQRFRREKDGIYRDVTKATLRGVTLTAFPAYPQTAGELAARSLEEWRDDEAKASKEAERLRESELQQLRKRLDFAVAAEPPHTERR